MWATTTAINLSYLLATEYRRRVLLIDADPQANATHALLHAGPDWCGLAGLLGGYATVYDEVVVPRSFRKQNTRQRRRNIFWIRFMRGA